MFVFIGEEYGLPEYTVDDEAAADAYALELNDGAVGLEEDAATPFTMSIIIRGSADEHERPCSTDQRPP